jgi:hypothetical protein
VSIKKDTAACLSGQEKTCPAVEGLLFRVDEAQVI